MTGAGQGVLFPADPVTAVDTPPAAGHWLDAVLEAGLTWRRSAFARLAPCRKCSALTLHAADLGLDLMTESTVDPRILDRGLEVRALLAGRYTAELEVRKHGGGPVIYRRDRWLAKREPNHRKRLWVPEHKCNDLIGYPIPLEIIYPTESRKQEINNVCPF